MSEYSAVIRATAQEFEQLLTKTALSAPGNDPPWIHSDVYLKITDDRVEAILNAGGGSILTYCTFEESYFDSLDGEAEAVIGVEKTLDPLSIAAEEGIMEIGFNGPTDSRLSEVLEAKGALEMGVPLPAAEKVLDKVPDELPERWSEDNVFLSPSGNPAPTEVVTTMDQLAKIEQAVELHDEREYFPVSVQDGEFVLNVGEGQDYLRGELAAESVEGPNLTNTYGPGFEAINSTLTGQVRLQSAPGESGGNPMAVVQETDSYTLRHVLVEVNPA